MHHLKKLASVGTEIAGGRPSSPWRDLGARHEELFGLLSALNGLYCFESALHVLPSGEGVSVERWNTPDLWRDAYGDLAEGCFFFAEDAFGNQFAIRGDRIVTFDAETGETEDTADSLEAWAEGMLANYEQLSGYPLARRWQELHGSLVPGHRLVPKIPFVLGGEFAVENLHALEAVKGMRWRGDLAVQIRDLPEGASIQLKVI